MSVTAVNDSIDNVPDRTATITLDPSGADYGNVPDATCAFTAIDNENPGHLALIGGDILSRASRTVANQVIHAIQGGMDCLRLRGVAVTVVGMKAIDTEESPDPAVGEPISPFTITVHRWFKHNR